MRLKPLGLLGEGNNRVKVIPYLHYLRHVISTPLVQVYLNEYFKIVNKKTKQNRIDQQKRDDYNASEPTQSSAEQLSGENNTLAQNVWPQGESRIGEKSGDFISSKQIGHVLLSI